MLDLYRRHIDDCPHRDKGREFHRCRCPIWCFGDLDGKPGIRKSTRTRDWARAAKRVAEWERNPAKPIYSPSLEKAVAAYLADCAARRLAPNTLRSYGIILDHLKEFCGAVRTDEVDLDRLTAFRGARKIEASTSVKELTAVRAFCSFAVQRSWMPENWAKKVKPPRVDLAPTMPFTEEEITAILDACDRLGTDDPSKLEWVRQRARAAILTLLYSGLRISDMTKLERKRVDFATRKLLLKIMKTRESLYVKLHQDACDALAALPETGRYFFWTGQGDLITAVKNMRRTIDRVLKLAGVEDGHPHRFRDTFSVALLEKGEDIRTVQLLLGHKSLKTTEKHYAPFVKGFQRILDAATEKLDFNSSKKTLDDSVQNPYNKFSQPTELA